MPSKRKEIASSPQPAKKRVRDAAADKLSKELKEVDTALKSAALTPEVQQMLTEILPMSLGQFCDQRVNLQERLVDSIAGILGEVQVTLEKEVADTCARNDESTAEKPMREKEAAEATESLKAKEAEVQRLKLALAEKAMAFRAATASLADAEAAKKADGVKAQEAAGKKADFELALQDLTLLKTTSTAEAGAGEKGDELMSLLKKYKFEESMMIALPAALAKEPEARGQFDMMAITQLEGDIGKKVAEQDSILAAAKPGQEKCEAAVREAQERLASVRAEQRAAAKSYDIASKEQGACEAAAAEAHKAVSNINQLLNRLGKAVYAAEADVEIFQQGPMAAFSKLREQSTPVPAEQPAAVLPSVQEQTTETLVEEVVAVC